jgi:hypothetical protein
MQASTLRDPDAFVFYFSRCSVWMAKWDGRPPALCFFHQATNIWDGFHIGPLWKSVVAYHSLNLFARLLLDVGEVDHGFEKDPGGHLACVCCADDEIEC